MSIDQFPLDDYRIQEETIEDLVKESLFQPVFRSVLDRSSLTVIRKVNDTIE